MMSCFPVGSPMVSRNNCSRWSGQLQTCDTEQGEAMLQRVLFGVARIGNGSRQPCNGDIASIALKQVRGEKSDMTLLQQFCDSTEKWLAIEWFCAMCPYIVTCAPHTILPVPCLEVVASNRTRRRQPTSKVYRQCEWSGCPAEGTRLGWNPWEKSVIG